VEWILPAEGQIPWGGTKRSPQGVAEFFRVLNEIVEYRDLSARETLAQDNRVVALGDSVAVLRANGRTVDQDWVMAFTIEDGKVTHYQYFDDTAKWVEALQG
jgi:ketosteroid isomerase-like protein